MQSRYDNIHTDVSHLSSEQCDYLRKIENKKNGLVVAPVKQVSNGDALLHLSMIPPSIDTLIHWGKKPMASSEIIQQVVKPTRCGESTFTFNGNQYPQHAVGDINESSVSVFLPSSVSEQELTMCISIMKAYWLKSSEVTRKKLVNAIECIDTIGKPKLHKVD
ncbi:hypothetical protein [Vibrio europaeus]|uniref:hypothetical protein n=1 Tax=Vibrio europaeus TaxID=300876 RepID=UPI00233EC5C3|nr:hypothetical protein [Vibrio europaeus]MDC5753566.1 hypothetical protein [Vibrio europaeus]MDC5816522.1 hypothetical protein [Vibrio europaeus]